MLARELAVVQIWLSRPDEKFLASCMEAVLMTDELKFFFSDMEELES